MTSPALPYTDLAPLSDVYADAVALAETYPVTPLPSPDATDLRATERGWTLLTDEISAEAELSGLYGD